MRILTYEEIVDLAKTDLGAALVEVKIALENDKENGSLVGLRMEIEDKLSEDTDQEADAAEAVSRQIRKA